MSEKIYLQAEYIHDGNGLMPEGTVIVVDDKGTILEITTKDQVDETIEVHYFDGILCPGFVNVHCHTELSNLYKLIPENTGLVNFVKAIPYLRMTLHQEQKMKVIEAAFDTMYSNGIVAIGDIANTHDSALMRVAHRMHVHTFVEALGFVPEGAAKRFEEAKAVYEQYQNSDKNFNGMTLKQSITPHAPYSVCDELYEAIDTFDPESIISIHNQESKSELEFFTDKSGQMNELYEFLKIDTAQLEIESGSTLDRSLNRIAPSHPLILVHNTFMPEEDMQKAVDRGAYICLCPNANWYIERAVPPVDKLVAADAKICLGTDSLASNYTLSIVAEMQRILVNYPEIAVETLIRWGTKNGAEALGLSDVVGSLKVGMRPGIVNLKSDFSIQLVANI